MRMEESVENNIASEPLPEVLHCVLDYLKKDGLTLAKLRASCGFFRGLKSLNDRIESYRKYDNKLYFGNHFSLFLDIRKTLWSCGNNAYGQLGQGEESLKGPDVTRFRKVPLSLEDEEQIEMVAVGYRHSILLSSKQRVLVCGSNEYGGLGKAKDQSASFIPLGLNKLKKNHDAVINVFAGGHCSALLTRNAVLYVREPDTHLVLDKDKSQYKHRFRKISLLLDDNETIQNVIFTDAHYFVLSSTGRLWQSKAFSLTLLALPLLRDDAIGSFATSKNHCLALTKQGRLFVQGHNQKGQLGLGQTQDVLSFMEVPVDFLHPQEQIVKIAAEEDISLILTSHGRLLGAGYDAYLMFCDYQQMDIGSRFKALHISTLEPKETIFNLSLGKGSLGLQTSKGRWIVQGENLCGNLSLWDATQPDDFNEIEFDSVRPIPVLPPEPAKTSKHHCSIL